MISGLILLLHKVKEGINLRLVADQSQCLTAKGRRRETEGTCREVTRQKRLTNERLRQDDSSTIAYTTRLIVLSPRTVSIIEEDVHDTTTALLCSTPYVGCSIRSRDRLRHCPDEVVLRGLSTRGDILLILDPEVSIVRERQ